MEVSQKLLDTYQKNVGSLKEVTETLLSLMKGHTYSFRKAITGRKGNLDRAKLESLVGTMLTDWAEYHRRGTPLQPGAKESVESYLQARRELYGLYLYLAMRCSLCEGAFALAVPGEDKERTDFAFLLAQAKRFSQNWCVMASPGEGKWNDQFNGLDSCFGLHLFRSFTDPEGGNAESGLTPDWKRPAARLKCLTNEGNRKRIHLRRLLSERTEKNTRDESGEGEEQEEREQEELEKNKEKMPGAGSDAAEEQAMGKARREADAAAQEEDGEYEEAADREDEDWYGIPEDDGDYDGEGQEDWDTGERWWEQPGAWEEGDVLTEEYNRREQLKGLARGFGDRTEYCEGCRRFAELYRKAGADVLRGFYEDLEEIVNLYLLQQGAVPLMDTDRALNVYHLVYQNACREARKYARGIQWDSM